MMSNSELIYKYFPNLNDIRKERFNSLFNIYKEWNSKVNIVSRKDIENIYEKHVLHSLSIAEFICFNENTNIIDVGTGGGFPGIPLAIMFPDSNFTLVDSIKKKVKVTEEVAKELNLKNVIVIQKRSNELKQKFDFVTGRAVTNFPKFVESVTHLISKKDKNSVPNGIIYLKGGEFDEEISDFKKEIDIININNFFEEEFFETKKIIYLPV